jgi:hypothetical protein
MPEQSVQSPPPLIQDPDADKIKPVLLSKSEDRTQFDPTKVFAAVGMILTVTMIILGMMWITLQNLEGRVNSLEDELTTTKISASDAAARLATKAATKSATSSAN